MLKYRIDQNVERFSSHPDGYRWSVNIFVDTDDDDRAVIECTGTAKNREEATVYADKFTRWAIKTYDIFGLQHHMRNDEEDVF